MKLHQRSAHRRTIRPSESDRNAKDQPKRVLLSPSGFSHIAAAPSGSSPSASPGASKSHGFNAPSKWSTFAALLQVSRGAIAACSRPRPSEGRFIPRGPPAGVCGAGGGVEGSPKLPHSQVSGRPATAAAVASSQGTIGCPMGHSCRRDSRFRRTQSSILPVMLSRFQDGRSRSMSAMAAEHDVALTAWLGSPRDGNCLKLTSSASGRVQFWTAANGKPFKSKALSSDRSPSTTTSVCKYMTRRKVRGPSPCGPRCRKPSK
mmetsp:Transcript_118542/g.340386  ORF Transcript_118542/g.340386 Transcript_118542/m.340386 type:complete len:261 (+) Transcript_118542:130-912(+)